MYCPSCERHMPDENKYCGKCGMFLNTTSDHFAHASINIGWILRRALGGFFAGGISWIVAWALARPMGSLHGFLLCVISGIFLS